MRGRMMINEDDAMRGGGAVVEKILYFFNIMRQERVLCEGNFPL
jgi:hypothetical protein